MYYLLDKPFQKETPLFKVLNEIYGVGGYQSKKCCQYSGFKTTIKWSKISKKRRSFLLDYFIREKTQMKDEELRYYEASRINKALTSKSFRGVRLKMGLPVRGQRTQTNKKTSRKLNKLRTR